MGTEETNFGNKLAELRANSCAELPTPQLAVLTRATARLRRSGILNRCLQTGETVPDFEFIDGTNSPATLYQLLGRGPVVINFFRGFWCMFCKTELDAYLQVKDSLDSLQCSYLAISPQPSVAAEIPHRYQTVFDRDNAIARRFGLVYSLEEDEISLFREWGLALDLFNEARSWELPLPATYVISKDRTVGYGFVDVDYRARCCPDELIEQVRRLVA